MGKPDRALSFIDSGIKITVAGLSTCFRIGERFSSLLMTGYWSMVDSVLDWNSSEPALSQQSNKSLKRYYAWNGYGAGERVVSPPCCKKGRSREIPDLTIKSDWKGEKKFHKKLALPAKLYKRSKKHHMDLWRSPNAKNLTQAWCCSVQETQLKSVSAHS